jgi:predicted DNA-binding transcriptional regulator AlpA
MEFIELAQVARRLGVSRGKAHAMTCRGEIPVVGHLGPRRVRLYRVEDVDRVAAERAARKAEKAAAAA